MSQPVSIDSNQQMEAVPSPQQVIDSKSSSNALQDQTPSPGKNINSPPSKSSENGGKNFAYHMQNQVPIDQYHQTYHHTKRLAENQPYAITNQTQYCCRTCGIQQSLCKCDRKHESLRTELAYGSFQPEQSQVNSGRLIERYLGNGTRQSPPSSSSSSLSASSSSTTSVASLINGSFLTMINQTNYEQDEFNNQQLQQHTVHHHQDQHLQYQQQVSSSHTSDNPHLVISGDGDHTLVNGEANNHQLTYNSYNEHDQQQQQDICTGSWTSLGQDAGHQHHSENCSSHNSNHHLHNQELMFKEQSFRLAGNNEMRPTSQQQQQHSQMSPQTYSHLSDMHKMAPSSGNSNDFNNNHHHHHHHSAGYSNFASADNLHQYHMHQGAYSTMEPGQDNELQEQQYSIANNNSSYYPDSSVCNEPAVYHNTGRHQQHYHHNQDGYAGNLNRFGLDSQQVTRQVQHESSTTQHSAAGSSHASTYEQLQQMEQVQSYQSDDRSQMKQFHAEHPYYTGISQVVIEQQREQQNDYNPPIARAQGDLSMQFELQQSDNQYQTNGNLTKAQGSYASLQQLTLNTCDNHANQVTTTTDRSTQGANKNRSLKGRRGRPRKKGLRSKSKLILMMQNETILSKAES